MSNPLAQPNMTRPELAQREKLIERGKRSFIEVGTALAEIRDRRGYRFEFKTFDDYCKTRWGWSRPNAAYYIDAAEVVKALPPETVTRVTVREASELAKLVKQSPRFRCPCGQDFDREVWHCPVCEHHWLMDRKECSNCGEGKQADAPRARSDQRKKQIDHAAVKRVARGIDFTKATVKQVAAAVNAEIKTQRLARARQTLAEIVPADTTGDGITIHNGDALEFLTSMPSESVHLVITSPPYPGVPKLWGERFAPENFERAHLWLDSIWDECARVLKPGCKLCINVANIGRRPYLYNSARVAQWGMRSNAVETIGEIVWHKFVGPRADGVDTAWGSWCNPSDPVLVDGHEYILIFRKHGTRVAPTKEPVIDKAQFLDWRKTLWQFHSAFASREGHCAPFPPELPMRLLTLYSFPGEVVLDPFAGSGTTLVEAVKLKRRGIGIELLDMNVKLAKRNLARVLSQDGSRQ